MGLFNNYEKAGKGISKNEARQVSFKSFFQILIRKFWSLVKLNLLYILFCLPIVTIGPATAGLVKVLKNYSIEKNSYIFSDFFDAFKSNWKKSGIIGLIDILIIVALGIALYIYPEMAKQSENAVYTVLLIVSLAIGITVIMMHFYLYQMIVSTDIKFKDIIKNSFILTSVGMKNNLIALLGITFILAIQICLFIFVSELFFILFLLITSSLSWFVICYSTYPVIEKYVINPYYEQQGLTNPDYDYLRSEDGLQTLFVDHGGNEAPVNYKKNNKSKFIS